MSGSTSGGSQKQSGYQSGQQQGSGYQIGVSGNQSDTTGSSSSRADPTQNWLTGSNNLFGNIGSTGLNAGEQEAKDAWRSYLLDPNNGVMQIRSANDAIRPLASATPYTAGPTSSVEAPLASSLMANYQNPWEDQVVQSTLSDLTKGYGEAQNANRLQQAAGGAFGGSRGAIQNAKTTDDFLRTLAGTSAGIRSQGFNTAVGAASGDASRQLTASGQNAANTLQREMFNAGQGNVADQTRLAAAGALSGNAATEQGLGSNATQQLFNMSGTGNSNILSALGSQIPAFGQSNTSTQTGSNYGVTGNATDYSGTSSGTNQSSGSSKGGGLGFG